MEPSQFIIPVVPDYAVDNLDRIPRFVYNIRINNNTISQFGIKYFRIYNSGVKYFALAWYNWILDSRVYGLAVFLNIAVCKSRIEDRGGAQLAIGHRRIHTVWALSHGVGQSARFNLRFPDDGIAHDRPAQVGQADDGQARSRGVRQVGKYYLGMVDRRIHDAR